MGNVINRVHPAISVVMPPKQTVYLGANKQVLRQLGRTTRGNHDRQVALGTRGASCSP